MKYLLVAINAKYIHSNLAVYSLKAFADEYSDKIDIAEYTINNQVDDILADIYERKADVVAFSCYIWNIHVVEDIIRMLGKVSPTTKIWVGGPEVSFRAYEFLEQFPQVSVVMCGEGEKNFKRLVAENEGDLDKPDITDLSCDEISDSAQVRQCVSPLNLSEVPFVYDDLTKFKNKIIYYESSRGCPFSCSYCLSSVDKKLRFRDIELVKKELQFFLDNDVKQVKFVDRTFNCRKEHSTEILKYILAHDNGVTNFHFEVAADLITEDDLQIMEQMRPGLIQLEIGVQSTNVDTIKEINRTMDFSLVSDVVKRINGYKNIHQHLDLIAGLPFENYESFSKSFNDVYDLNPNQLQLGFLKVLSGSQMYKDADAYGVVYRDTPPYEVLYTKWIKYDEMLKLKQIERVVEIFYNSRQFENTMEVLVREFDDAFSMYSELGIHYDKYCRNGEKHSRIERYNILLEFIKVHTNRVPLEAYTELLTLDVYLRDNMKTRPLFSKDLSEEKSFIREIFLNEEKIRKILPEYGDYTCKQIMTMTHTEIFDYDMMALVNMGNLIKRRFTIIFNYKKRSSLSGDAVMFFYQE